MLCLVYLLFQLYQMLSLFAAPTSFSLQAPVFPTVQRPSVSM